MAGMHGMQQRSALRATLDVWYALFLREATARINADRLGWSWMFLEPALHIAFMYGIRELMGRIHFIGGMNFLMYFISGFCAFFIFRDVATRGEQAINANKALFAYSQVLPVDTVLVRAFLEGVLGVVVLGLFVAAISVFYLPIWPQNVLQVVAAIGLLWLMGLGLALVLSVLISVVQESSKITSFMFMPLYILSGVLIPVQMLPHSVQQWLIWNPILHGLELVRQGFYPSYHMVNGVNWLYPSIWGISLLLLGMALHARYKMVVISR